MQNAQSATNPDVGGRRGAVLRSGTVEAPAVLVVEDDATIGESLAAVLRGEGYDVRLVTDGGSALAEAEAAVPELVLLDLGLPDVDGLSICRQLKMRFASTRIIVVTARADEADVVVGFDTGADDYVIKPFRLAELLARVRAQLRKPAPEKESDSITVGDLCVDRRSRRAFVGDEEVELRPKEFDLLALLASYAGSVVTRERIMLEVWETDWLGTTKTLDMHVSSLRKKLAASSVKITTLRHIGYRLDE